MSAPPKYSADYYRAEPLDVDEPAHPRSGEHLTELGLAERLVAKHGKDLRFCSSLGWLIWRGKLWQVDDTGEIFRRAKKTIRDVLREAARIEDADERRKLASFALKSETAAHITNLIRLAESEPPIPVRASDLDTSPDLLNLDNGVLDLRTAQLRAHCREDLLTKMSPVAYDIGAKCPTFDRFLERVLPSESLRLFAQRAVGYAATGHIREHVLHVLWGNGANGKSTFLSAILDALGDYAMVAPPRLLMLRRHEPHPAELADLFGRRFVACLESGQGSRLDEEMVKRLTGGDHVKARFMRQNFFEFAPTHKLFVATNHRPRIRGTDSGIWRRVRLWPFNVQIPAHEQDTELPEKLRRERAGILRWIVEGTMAWRRSGLNEPPEVIAATETYRNDSDVMAGFVSECCLTGDAHRADGVELWDTFTRWAERSGERDRPSKREFREALVEHGFAPLPEKHPRTRRVMYHGIGLLDEACG